MQKGKIMNQIFRKTLEYAVKNSLEEDLYSISLTREGIFKGALSRDTIHTQAVFIKGYSAPELPNDELIKFSVYSIVEVEPNSVFGGEPICMVLTPINECKNALNVFTMSDGRKYRYTRSGILVTKNIPKLSTGGEWQISYIRRIKVLAIYETRALTPIERNELEKEGSLFEFGVKDLSDKYKYVTNDGLSISYDDPDDIIEDSVMITEDMAKKICSETRRVVNPKKPCANKKNNRMLNQIKEVNKIFKETKNFDED